MKLTTAFILALKLANSDTYCVFTTKGKTYTFNADMDLETFKYISEECIDNTMMEHNADQANKIINNIPHPAKLNKQQK